MNYDKLDVLMQEQKYIHAVREPTIPKDNICQACKFKPKNFHNLNICGTNPFQCIKECKYYKPIPA